MEKTNSNSQSVQVAPEQKTTNFKAKLEFVERFVINPVLFAQDEDGFEDISKPLPNFKYRFRKVQEEYGYAFAIQEQLTEPDDKGDIEVKTLWCAYLSEYATNIGEILTNGKRIYKMIVKDACKFLEQHPEMLELNIEEIEVA